jgi:selenoprotein W-related protein
LNDNGIDASIREGAKSQYDVVVDGETIFSKEELGRFPEDGEVLELLGARS